MNEKEAMKKTEKMSLEEKLKLLSETDKAFINGYIERALRGFKSAQRQKRRKAKLKGT